MQSDLLLLLPNSFQANLNMGWVTLIGIMAPSYSLHNYINYIIYVSLLFQLWSFFSLVLVIRFWERSRSRWRKVVRALEKKNAWWEEHLQLIQTISTQINKNHEIQRAMHHPVVILSRQDLGTIPMIHYVLIFNGQ